LLWEDNVSGVEDKAGSEISVPFSRMLPHENGALTSAEKMCD
jgi:hypothetical protein